MGSTIQYFRYLSRCEGAPRLADFARRGTRTEATAYYLGRLLEGEVEGEGAPRLADFARRGIRTEATALPIPTRLDI